MIVAVTTALMCMKALTFSAWRFLVNRNHDRDLTAVSHSSWRSAGCEPKHLGRHFANTGRHRGGRSW